MICTFQKNVSKWAKEKERDGACSTRRKDESYMQILGKINDLEVVYWTVILKRTWKKIQCEVVRCIRLAQERLQRSIVV